MSLAGAIEAGKAVIRLGMPTGDVEKALLKLQKKAEVIGSKFKAIGSIGVKAGGVVATAFGGLGKLFADVGGELDDLSQRTGASATFLSEVGYAAKMSGSSLEAVEKGMKGMSKTLLNASNGSKGAIDSLAALGLTVDDLAGKSPEQQFMMLAQQISAITDPTTRAALAMKIFGGAGQELLPMFAGGAGGIQALRDEAVRLGISMGEETVAAAAKLGERLDQLWAQVVALGVQIGAAVAGPMTEWLTKSQETIASTIDWVKENQTLITVVAAVGVGLAAIGTAAYAVGTAFTVASTAIMAFRVVMLAATAHPLIAALALVAAAVMAIAVAFGFASDGTEDLKKDLEEVGKKNDALQRQDETTATRKETQEQRVAAATTTRQKAELDMQEEINRAREEELATTAELKANLVARAKGGNVSVGDTGGLVVDALLEATGAEESFKTSPTARPMDPVSMFDTRFAAMQFGGGRDFQEEQLEELKKINKELQKSKEFGIPVE